MALVREDISIACEITLTTTVNHEVGNVVKCRESGFHLVAIVSRGLLLYLW